MSFWNSRTDEQKLAAVAFVMLSALLLVLTVSRPETTLDIANRTEATLAIGPGVVIPACSTETVSLAQFTQAQIEERQSGWKAPEGSVPWASLSFALAGDWGGPGTVVVSSTALPEFLVGTAGDADSRHAKVSRRTG